MVRVGDYLQIGLLVTPDDVSRPLSIGLRDNVDATVRQRLPGMVLEDAYSAEPGGRPDVGHRVGLSAVNGLVAEVGGRWNVDHRVGLSAMNGLVTESRGRRDVDHRVRVNGTKALVTSLEGGAMSVVDWE